MGLQVKAWQPGTFVKELYHGEHVWGIWVNMPSQAYINYNEHYILKSQRSRAYV